MGFVIEGIVGSRESSVEGYNWDSGGKICCCIF